MASVNGGAEWQAAKQECPEGHKYTPRNTYVYTDKQGRVSRKCRRCGRAANKRFRQSHKP